MAAAAPVADDPEVMAQKLRAGRGKLQTKMAQKQLLDGLQSLFGGQLPHQEV